MIAYCIVLYVYIHIALIPVHTNQKCFHLHTLVHRCSGIAEKLCAKNLLKVPYL